MTDTEKLILDQIKALDAKLDEVRTKDLPGVKTDVALLVQDAKTASKWYSTLGGFLAILVSSLMPHR